MNDDAVHRLKTRNVDQILPEDGLDELLESGKTLRIKLGIDPTGPMIHLGHAVVLWKLREFQDLGHQIVIIIGDFTARIGDPSDKTGRRPVLTNSDIETNLAEYKNQLGKILDLSKVEFRRNSEWLEPLGMDDLLQLMRVFTVNQMLARRNFAERYKAEQPIGLDEFLYPLMQGFDSVAMNADVEIGGTDQLFNVGAGRIMQEAHNQPTQSILVCNLLLGTDGEKMSKTSGNTIAVSAEPEDMFGQVMALDDKVIDDYLVMATDATEEEIESIVGEANPKDAKIRLAEKVVDRYYGASAANKARAAFETRFSKKESTDVAETYTPTNDTITAVDALVDAFEVKSKSEARRVIEQGGFKLDGKPIKDPAQELKLKDGQILQKGKFLQKRVKF